MGEGEGGKKGEGKEVVGKGGQEVRGAERGGISVPGDEKQRLPDLVRNWHINQNLYEELKNRSPNV